VEARGVVGGLAHSIKQVVELNTETHLLSGVGRLLAGEGVPIIFIIFFKIADID